MKKIAILIAFFALFLDAKQNLDASELFGQAQIYENNGEIKKAMALYKQIAQLAIKEQNLNTQNHIQPSQLAIKQDQILAQEAKNPDENQPQSSQISSSSKLTSALDETLGIRLYHLNYLLPATYAKNVPNDERKRFETKFQFSVQKPVVYDLLGLKETLAVAYSQTSWWQTARPSTPFRESNYRPEIYLKFDTRDIFEWINLNELQTGFLHESNGKDGEDSRSWNRIYAQAKFDLGKLTLTPRAWVVVGDLGDNRDIKDYMGKADISASWTYHGHIFNAMVRSNLQFDKTYRGAAQFDWLFPLGNNGFYGYLQYFTGYGESLIDYNRNTDKVGIGLTLLR